MVIVMKSGATLEEIERVVERLTELGFDAHVSPGTDNTVIGAVGVNGRGVDVDDREMEILDGKRLESIHTRSPGALG